MPSIYPLSASYERIAESSSLSSHFKSPKKANFNAVERSIEILSYPHEIITICGNRSYRTEKKNLNGPLNCIEIRFLQ
jgi:hypothetical protein